MNRMFKLPLLIALSLGSTQLLAVDFGQVRVMSSLGQPLRAEIPVRGATPAELKSLTAELASADEYDRAGISGGRTRVPLDFSVVSAAGRHFIRITSTAPVDDPYLDLLLDVNTAAGRSVHEFAILLDPPAASESAVAGGADQAAAHAPAAAREAAAAATPPAAAPAVPAAAATGRPAGAGAVAKGMYGPVERGQTLSGIAQQTLPAGVDVNQMLLAIKQANPDAFYRDNINTLKSGVVLRVPSAADAQAMTVAAAMAEVRRQNSDWRAGSTGTPATVADAATRPAASGAAATAAPKGGDRLALLAAKDTGKAGAMGGAGGQAGESAAELRKNLMRAQESLASEQQQVADLKAHLKELDDVNSKSERLLSLKNSEIAELQTKLAAARKSGFVAPASSAGGKAALAESAAVAGARSAPSTAPAAAANPAAGSSAGDHAAAAASAALAKPAPVAAAASPKPAAKAGSTPAPAPKPDAAMQPWYMQTWAWIAGAGAVVLLILLALLGRQGKRTMPAPARTAPSLADSFGDASPASGLPVDDVDQNELLDQLAEHPDDIDLHLQLVTLYYSRRDVEHFEAAAEAMYAHISDPQEEEWQDVVHMGEDLVPEHPLFAAHLDQPPAAESEPLQDFNIDDYADDDSLALSRPVAMASATMDYPGVKESRIDFNAGSPSGFHSVSDELDVAPEVADADVDAPVGMASGSALDAPGPGDGVDDGLGEFNDDPIDTKLDLARAYLDMGDDEGARAMLDEVLKEGSQMQKDVATALLGGM